MKEKEIKNISEKCMYNIVQLHEVEGKLHAKLNSDHPDGFDYRANEEKIDIICFSDVEGEKTYFLYDERDETKDVNLENFIYSELCEIIEKELNVKSDNYYKLICNIVEEITINLFD